MKVQHKQECNDRSGPTGLRLPRTLRLLRRGLRRRLGNGDRKRDRVSCRPLKALGR